MNFRTGLRLVGRILDMKINRIGKPKLISSEINELGETVNVYKTKRIFGKPHISRLITQEVAEKEMNSEVLDFLS